ncbi:MAG: sigma-70 family RNA polymerase sigma factor [Candidatus Dormibacteraeota bacterium]|nr:sigma-70 family RNA polymerase sigma factor [Candidatus Dormibacteraeota bacterium]
MDDEALLERARRGDRDAFAAIVTRHQDELYTMALRILGTPHDAADVVQETFLRAFTRIPELRGATVRAWLFRVAVNCAHDVQRRAVRRPTSPLEDSAGNVLELPDPGLGPEASALARERVAAIRNALLTLPPDFRTAVVLRDVNELSYEEISDALRIPVGTVKSRLSRARHMLVAALQGTTAMPNAAEGGA